MAGAAGRDPSRPAQGAAGGPVNRGRCGHAPGLHGSGSLDRGKHSQRDRALDLLAEPSSPAASPVALEAARRRTFAIISHPDAGKTTLTEKLLLAGGAIQLAGDVRAKGERRRTRSDWMEIERERGISVVTSVMTFEHGGLRVQPARHAGPRGLLRGHLPHAHRRRFRGHGDRRRQGHRGADPQAVRGLPAARHPDHHLHQQDGPRGAATRSSCWTRSRRPWRSTPRRSTWPVGRGRDFAGTYDLRGKHFLPRRCRRCRAIPLDGIDDPRLDALVRPERARHCARRLAWPRRPAGVRPARPSARAT